MVGSSNPRHDRAHSSSRVMQVKGITLAMDAGERIGLSVTL